ncbi:MAG: alkaline phosphatase family protein [Sphingomonas sp.]
MKFLPSIAIALSLLAASPIAAQEAPPAPPSPKLIVVISVDQFSADLFAEYRAQFRFGFARLMQGAVFPSGYQSHSATETCPGHSTILTGDHPARTGIVANDWIDLRVTRADKTVYCVEDETIPGTDSGNYTVSDKHLRVSTLGEWMKAANPASRVVSVAGKDRAAIMMGGHRIDELWYWWDKSKQFVSYPGRTAPAPAAVAKINASLTQRLAEAQTPLDLPAFCKPRDRAIPVGGGKTVGDGRFARDAGAVGKFKASPEFDDSIVALAAGLVTELKLGQGSATDLIAIGASATDYVGHAYGTEGTEMCLQLFALDETLGRLFAVLDSTGVDYEVVLTADHGGHDLPERNQQHAAPTAERIAAVAGDTGPVAALTAARVGADVAQRLGLSGQILWGGSFGDMWIDPKLTKAQHDRVLAEAVKAFAADRQVAAVFTRAQIAATPPASGPPETWTLIERARASFDTERSGDFVVALKPRVTPIADPVKGATATHGSFWDYDRRVPILFWRKGMVGFEQPLSIETVDIAPTLAATIGLRVPVAIDGRCLDLDAGPGDSCAR